MAWMIVGGDNAGYGDKQELKKLLFDPRPSAATVDAICADEEE